MTTATTTTTLETSVYPSFDADAFAALAAAGHVGPDADTAGAKRQAAFDAYCAIDAPTATTEEYRRTPPRLLKLGEFERLPDVEWGCRTDTHDWDDAFDIVVTVNGHRAGISGTAPGVSVTPLAETDAGILAEYLNGAASPEVPRKMRELNNAFWNVGLCVHVAKGVKLERGILVRYHVPAAGALLPRLLVVAEENSEFTMAEVFSSGDEPVQCISNRELYAAAGANVRLVSLQDWGEKAIHIGEDWALAKRDATVNICTLTLGGKTSKMATGCDVCEPGANAYMGGLYFARGRQHFDQMTLQRHSAPNTYSNMLYKGAAKKKGYSVYQGIIQATHGSIGVDAYQTNNNLILDNDSRADSLPGLIINADELACSHGATMGNLDEEQVYYLRSRGIDELTARKMMVIGFFDEIVEERIPYEPIRDHLHDVIERKLAE